MLLYTLNPDTTISIIDQHAFLCGAVEDAEDKHLFLSEIGPYTISTVFLGFDLNPFVGVEPHLFETMVFRNDDQSGCYQRRHPTFYTAFKGHELAMCIVDFVMENDQPNIDFYEVEELVCCLDRKQEEANRGQGDA